MPRYEFQLQGGREVIEEYFPAADAPELGSTIVRDGKTFVRILSHAPMAQPVWKPYATLQLAKWKPGYQHDANGRCCIPTQKAEREMCAKENRKRD